MQQKDYLFQLQLKNVAQSAPCEGLSQALPQRLHLAFCHSRHWQPPLLLAAAPVSLGVLLGLATTPTAAAAD
jgi:hypothetical protein